jgi:peptide deformylase
MYAEPNSPVLNTPTKWVDGNFDAYEPVIMEMANIALNNGFDFLTANQLGHRFRAAVVIGYDGVLGLFNPTIQWVGNWRFREESFPNKLNTIVSPRPDEVTVTAQNQEGLTSVLNLKGDQAASVYAACMFLDGKPPWKYRNLELPN